MIRNYLLLAYRNLLKTRWISLVNIGGLCLGIAAGILILNYVSYEKSYDNIHEKGDRIYRVESQFFEDGELSDDWATASFGYASAMHSHFPDVYFAFWIWGDGQCLEVPDSSILPFNYFFPFFSQPEEVQRDSLGASDRWSFSYAKNVKLIDIQHNRS